MTEIDVKKKVAAMFSYHLYDQPRRGGMHWLCDSLRKSGWDVRFITCDFSYITKFRGDRRTESGRVIGLNSLERVNDSLSLSVIFTPFHSVGRGSGILSKALDLVTSHYPWPRHRLVERLSAGSDLVIIESCGALFMVDLIRQATMAPIIYRVSDNISVLRPVPALLRAEIDAASKVNAVSLASERLAQKFQMTGRVRIDPMGIEKSIFDEASKDPYQGDKRKKVVISGSSGLDVTSLADAARSKPDWLFVQFGTAKKMPQLPNIRAMGEVAFRDMVPWVKYADIGFAPYIVRPGFEYQAEHSNRLLQYTYCGIPSLVPQELCIETKPHFIGYSAGDCASMAAALDEAADFERSRVPRTSVFTWDEVAKRVASVADHPVGA